MAVSAEERERVRGMDLPPAAEVRKRLSAFMGATDASCPQMAAEIGYSEPSLRMFLLNTYTRIAGTDRHIRAAIAEYLDRNPIAPRRHVQGRLFQTENYRRIRGYFRRALEHGEVALLYGPPGTQKTFVLEYQIAEANREKRGECFYVYASDEMKSLAMLKRIAREAGVLARLSTRDRLLSVLINAFGRMDRPPVVVMDEAQHLDVHCLEILRELHDRSGCGMVLAGSHNLFENFLRGRAQLEQWLSRIDYKEPLPGLQEKEVAQIAERELSNGRAATLSEKQVQKIVAACRVEDIFGRDESGKRAARQYLSVRRLVKFIAQLKESKVSVRAGEEVA